MVEQFRCTGWLMKMDWDAAAVVLQRSDQPLREI